MDIVPGAVNTINQISDDPRIGTVLVQDVNVGRISHDLADDSRDGIKL